MYVNVALPTLVGVWSIAFVRSRHIECYSDLRTDLHIIGTLNLGSPAVIILMMLLLDALVRVPAKSTTLSTIMICRC